MDFITVRQASEKWGMNKRMLQEFCKQGRIPGAIKVERSWFIPSDAQKPIDPRKARKLDGTITHRYDHCGVLSCVIPMPKANADTVLDGISDAATRNQYAAEIAYLRGEFDDVLRYFFTVPTDSHMFACACVCAVSAAISLGDMKTYQSIHDRMQLVKRPVSSADEIVLTFPDALAAVASFTPELAPQWLADGDLSVLPARSREFGVYLMAKYFHCRRDFIAMRTCARTRLALVVTQDGFTFADVYQYLICSIACAGLGESSDVQSCIEHAMELALPNGFATPFAETISSTSAIMERCIRKHYPDMLARIVRQWEMITNNWYSFHNRLTHEKMPTLLVLAEYQAAVMAAYGESNENIARNMECSVSYVKKLLSQVYEKLGISRREQLKAFFN